MAILYCEKAYVWNPDALNGLGQKTGQYQCALPAKISGENVTVRQVEETKAGTPRYEVTCDAALTEANLGTTWSGTKKDAETRWKKAV